MSKGFRSTGDEASALKCLEGRIALAKSEGPQRRVIITKGFLMGAHEVTQKDFTTVMGFNMSGNVSEWCADRYDPQGYAAAPLEDPTGPSEGTARVYRGGSCTSDAGRIRSAQRETRAPKVCFTVGGFRVACNAVAVVPPVAEAPAPAGLQEIEARLKEKGLGDRRRVAGGSVQRGPPEVAEGRPR